DDDDNPKEDPNEEHEPEDSDETKPFEEDETAVTPPPPKYRGARISVKPQTPMTASTHALIDAFAVGSTPFPLPPTSPAYDQAPLGQGLICNSGNDAQTIARAADRAEDVGYVRALQASKHRMMTFIEEVNLRFKGTEGIVGLSQWLKKMESVFYISACAIDNQVKFATYTLLDETKNVDKYISGLPDNIHGNVMSTRPKTLDETIELANDLMDLKLRTYAERQNDNKRKTDDSSRNMQLPSHWAMCTQLWKMQEGGRDASPDSNVITCTFLLNKRYPKILFDTGADKSFVSTTFSASIDITPTTLENHYDVELDDKKIIGVNTIIRGCTLNFRNHPFNIDLMHVPLDSFDVIIGMDWLTKYHGVIICDEKIVRVPFGREITRVFVEGCDFFLAHVTTNEAKDKSEGKRLEDVPIVRDYPEVFPEDLSSIPPARQVEFQIDMVLGAAPVAWAPYRLAPSEMKELATQINSKGIHVDPAKIDSIKDWASPKSPTKIRQFLGLAGYYRRFIEGFSQIAKSVTKLTQKNIKFDWGEKKEAAFQLIKQKLCSAPILALPKGSENIIVYYDTLHKGLEILEAQTEALKPENLNSKDVGGMLRKDLPKEKLEPQVEDAQLTGPEIIQETTKKIIQIKSRIKAARERQKSYADLKRKPIDFQVGDMVMFKCLSDKSLVIPLDELCIDDKLHFVEERVEIIDHEIKQLKKSRIPIIKVRWNFKQGLEFTWEREDQFKQKYPQLFAKTAPSSSAAS
nr:reverse transcriptase domain-containing protein [Tanacetum cinerariifolium]